MMIRMTMLIRILMRTSALIHAFICQRTRRRNITAKLKCNQLTPRQIDVFCVASSSSYVHVQHLCTCSLVSLSIVCIWINGEKATWKLTVRINFCSCLIIKWRRSFVRREKERRKKRFFLSSASISIGGIDKEGNDIRASEWVTESKCRTNSHTTYVRTLAHFVSMWLKFLLTISIFMRCRQINDSRAKPRKDTVDDHQR